jgi:serine/threonine protein kinase
MSGPAPPRPLSLSLSGLFGSAKEPEKPIISFNAMKTQFLEKKGVYTSVSEKRSQSILFVKDSEKPYVVKLGNHQKIPERGDLTKYDLINEETSVYERIGESPYFPKKIEYGEYDHFNYLIIEYIEGRTLYDFVFEEQIRPLSKIFTIGLGITQAINELYKMGYTHGDLSPHNIMIKDESTVVLIDFERAEPKGRDEYNHKIQTNMKGITRADEGDFEDDIFKLIKNYKETIKNRNAPIPGYIFLVGILFHLLNEDDKKIYEMFLKDLWTELTTNFNKDTPYEKCIELFNKKILENDVPEGGGGGGSQRKTRKSQKGGRKKIESRKRWKRKSKPKCQRKLL